MPFLVTGTTPTKRRHGGHNTHAGRKRKRQGTYIRHLDSWSEVEQPVNNPTETTLDLEAIRVPRLESNTIEPESENDQVSVIVAGAAEGGGIESVKDKFTNWCDLSTCALFSLQPDEFQVKPHSSGAVTTALGGCSTNTIFIIPR